MAATHTFQTLDTALQSWVTSGLLPGVCAGVLRHGELVHQSCVGYADIARAEPLRPDHIHRAFSSTKLMTACAALLLWEQGAFGLDDPIEAHIPALGQRQVLRPGATRIDDTEPARSPITIRHLFAHSSGLALGLLDADSLLFKAYAAAGVRDASLNLAQLMDALAPIPLAFHPGARWGYSIATDVLARLVEVHSGQRFGDYIAQRIFAPLGMVDTAHHTPPDKQHRLTTLYGADKNAPPATWANPADPRSAPLVALTSLRYPGAMAEPVARQSGSGGTVTTLPDSLALLRALTPSAPGFKLLKPETLALLTVNQLAGPDGAGSGEAVVDFLPECGVVKGKGYGLFGAVTAAGAEVTRPAHAIPGVEWGGLGATHWWISPDDGLAVALMTQRYIGFFHPFWFEVKRLVRQAGAQDLTRALGEVAQK